MDEILHLSNLVFDVKDKLTDNEFLNIMTAMSKIYKGRLIDHKVYCLLRTLIQTDEDQIDDCVITTFYLTVGLPEKTDYIYQVDWEDNFLMKKMIEKKGSLSLDQFPYINSVYDRHRNNVTYHIKLHNFSSTQDTCLEFLSVNPLNNT